MEDLAERDADAPIFSKLGLTYGKAVRFKKEFGRILPKKIGWSSRPSSPAPSKPTMVEMANFSPEMRQLYLSKYAVPCFHWNVINSEQRNQY